MSKIRLDQILFDRKLAESKSKAQAMIMAGQVCVEDKVINKSGYNINPDAKIKIKDIMLYFYNTKIYHIFKAFFDIMYKSIPKFSSKCIKI